MGDNLAPTVGEHLPQIAGYEAIGVLGRGASGTVFLAVQTQLDRKVAIKRLGVDGSGLAQLERRFRREARTLAALDHPNIVRIYDFVGDATGLYLVMEFVDGPTLRQLQSRLTVSTSLGCLRQLTSAIDYAHSRGVVHRDIKPENVLVSPTGTYKLADFGISKVIADSLRATSGSALATEAGDIVGTAHYISPEAAAGKLDIGPEADIYSLGVFAYELLVGRLPFDQTNVWEVLLAHESDAPPRPSELRSGFPGGVESVLLRALQKDPIRRPRSASSFWGELDAAATLAWPGWDNEASVQSFVETGDIRAHLPAVDDIAKTEPPASHEESNHTILVSAWRAQEHDSRVNDEVRLPTPIRPAAPTHAFRPGRRRRRRAIEVVLTTVLAALVAVVVTMVLARRSHAGGGLTVTSVSLSVTPSGPGHCPQAIFDFRGDIALNGHAGELIFRWQRPDGTSGPVQSRSISQGATLDPETLQFTFSGSGSTAGEAALHVMSPANVSSVPIPVRYSCP